MTGLERTANQDSCKNNIRYGPHGPIRSKGTDASPFTNMPTYCKQHIHRGGDRVAIELRSPCPAKVCFQNCPDLQCPCLEAPRHQRRGLWHGDGTRLVNFATVFWRHLPVGRQARASGCTFDPLRRRVKFSLTISRAAFEKFRENFTRVAPAMDIDTIAACRHGVRRVGHARSQSTSGRPGGKSHAAEPVGAQVPGARLLAGAGHLALASGHGRARRHAIQGRPAGPSTKSPTIQDPGELAPRCPRNCA